MTGDLGFDIAFSALFIACAALCLLAIRNL